MFIEQALNRRSKSIEDLLGRVSSRGLTSSRRSAFHQRTTVEAISGEMSYSGCSSSNISMNSSTSSRENLLSTKLEANGTDHACAVIPHPFTNFSKWVGQSSANRVKDG